MQNQAVDVACELQRGTVRSPTPFHNRLCTKQRLHHVHGMEHTITPGPPIRFRSLANARGEPRKTRKSCQADSPPVGVLSRGLSSPPDGPFPSPGLTIQCDVAQWIGRIYRVDVHVLAAVRVVPPAKAQSDVFHRPFPGPEKD